MNAEASLSSPRPVKLRIEDFFLLNDAGAFRDYGKTELIDGEIVAMSAQLSSHAHVKGLLFRRLADAVEQLMPGYHVWSEATIAVPPSDAPEPDILVTSFRPNPRAATPVETVPLSVEVTDTTAHYDLGRKLRLYASAGVPEYWVVELGVDLIHQFWSPAGDAYAEQRAVKLGKRIEAVTLPGLAIETSGLD